MFAEWKQGAALRLDVRRQRFPFGATDGAEENGVCRLACGDGFGWEWVAARIDGGTADQMLGACDMKAKLGLNSVEDAKRLGHNFWADAVSGENRDAVTA
jgi:hypothetical protein